MRFALSLASVLVLGSAAFAEEAAPPAPAPAPATTPPAAPATAAAAKKLPLRVVRVLEDTQQALMFDRAKGTHVLVEVGKQIDGFTVTDIDEDSVTLTSESGQQIVLAGPDPSWRGNGRHGAQKRDAKAVAKAANAAPEDPYAAAAPMDPYRDDGVRTAEAPVAPSATAAPITAGEGGVRTAEAPVAGTPAESVRSAEAPGTPAKVVVTATIPSSTIPTAVTSTGAPTSTSPLASTSATTTITAPSTPIISATAPVEAPVAAPSAEPVGPMDNSSSAAWSTTPTPPVDRETAAIASLFTDAKPDAKPAPIVPTTKAKATKATKTSKAKDPKIASVSAAGTPAGAAVPATAAASADGATIIAKADVTAALGNFSALAGAVRGSFSANGAHLDAVAPDSLFAKAGLQAGDTITAINNQPLRSLDDAATLYSRAGSMKSATIQVVRAGKPLSLRLAIQ